jgi:eukaryotic-like serine/threonine-protein kinase
MQNKSTNKEIKGYKILGKIAKGGMGEVFKGIHPGLNKEIILKKLMSKATASFSDRFKREAALMMEVSHPNVVHLFDYFKEGSSSYIVMEYIPGYNLSEFIAKFGKLPVYLASYIAIEVAKGLEYAHSKGIIHRDIKPGNVLISMKGEIKLTDFGIAFKASREDDITKTGTLLGTPSYMSPEQIYSSKDVDSRTDIYSLGVIFYEMLTGIKPFSNQFTMENVIKIKKGKCQSIRSVNRNVPPSLVNIIKKMMNPKKNKRYDTITQFISKIQPFIMKKFKNPVFLKDNFNKLIVKQNPVYELNHFKYPNSFILLKRVMNISLVLLALSSIFLFLRFFFPGLLLFASFPEKYGITNILINDEDSIEKGSLLFISDQGQTIKSIDINTDAKIFGINNMILPAAKYSLLLRLHENIFIKETLILSYKQQKENNINFSIQNPYSKEISFNISVKNAVDNSDIKEYKLYYRISGEKNWIEYSSDLKLYNGMNYDFEVYADKFNISIIKNIQIGFRQDHLDLNFVLSEKRVSVKFNSQGIPLIIRIDGKDRGYTDIDGIIDEKFILTAEKEIFLIPGEHLFNFYNIERNINNSFRINLSDNKDHIIIINYDESSKKLFIKED